MVCLISSLDLSISQGMKRWLSMAAHNNTSLGVVHVFFCPLWRHFPQGDLIQKNFQQKSCGEVFVPRDSPQAVRDEADLDKLPEAE